VGLAAGGIGSLDGVEDGAGAAGLSMLGSVVTGAAPVGLSQRSKCISQCPDVPAGATGPLEDGAAAVSVFVAVGT